MYEFQAGGAGAFQPFAQHAFAQGLAPQGFLGGLLGGPLGGLAGKAIGSLAGNPGLGQQIGQFAGGIGGAFLPFGADPLSQYYAQQQMHALQPQGWLGTAIGQLGQPLGGLIGGAFGNQGLGQSIGGIAGQLGRMLPFGADPVSQFYAQQAHAMQPQGWLGSAIGQLGQPLGGLIGGAFGNQGLGQSIGGIAGQLGRMLPFGADPVSQFYAQQLQGMQPQGWLGTAIGQLGQPLGGLIGGALGNQGLGQTLGGIAGQLGRMLPFGADPSQWMGGQLPQMQQPYGGLSGFGGQQANAFAQPTLH